MTKFLWAMILITGCAQAQAGVPTTSAVGADGANSQARPVSTDSLPSERVAGSKVGLVRGALERLEPIHDQLLVHAFGGGDVRIAFDTRTQLLSDGVRTRLTSIPAGSVVSVDTVLEDGKLFARSVRTGPSTAGEVNGQIVRYDAAKLQLTLRDALSPENVSLHITSSTVVVNRGLTASPQALSPGMLVRVQFSPKQKTATNIEILAERGNSFTFQGRIVAVDLRLHVLALSNDSDESVRELTIASLNASSLRLLREGADVSVQAEFDGNRYNVRTVTLVSPAP
jgi:hypothetical protein